MAKTLDSIVRRALISLVTGECLNVCPPGIVPLEECDSSTSMKDTARFIMSIGREVRGGRGTNSVCACPSPCRRPLADCMPPSLIPPNGSLSGGSALELLSRIVACERTAAEMHLLRSV